MICFILNLLIFNFKILIRRQDVDKSTQFLFNLKYRELYGKLQKLNSSDLKVHIPLL
jgi:hypothetical protein